MEGQKFIWLDTEDETEDDEAMEEEKVGDEMEMDAEYDAEVGNLETAWQMFDLAKVIYGKAGDVVKECESLTLLGEVKPCFLLLLFPVHAALCGYPSH